MKLFLTRRIWCHVNEIFTLKRHELTRLFTAKKWVLDLWTVLQFLLCFVGEIMRQDIKQIFQYYLRHKEPPEGHCFRPSLLKSPLGQRSCLGCGSEQNSPKTNFFLKAWILLFAVNTVVHFSCSTRFRLFLQKYLPSRQVLPATAYQSARNANKLAINEESEDISTQLW